MASATACWVGLVPAAARMAVAPIAMDPSTSSHHAVVVPMILSAGLVVLNRRSHAWPTSHSALARSASAVW